MRATKKLIPELRFPEFQKAEEWQRTTIGEVGTFYYGKSAPKWSLSSDAPTLCVRYGELYTKFDTIISEIISRSNIDPSNLRFSKGGEILIPRVGEVPQDFAKNCCYLPFPNIAIGEMISVYETKEYPIFYAYYFRTLWKQFAEVVEGQNVKNLYYVNLEPIVVGKPSYFEQQKIASCLSCLDEVIVAHSQKLDALKDHKKGLAQNLFPQEGETVPKWRFPEFVNDGEWAEKKLGEVCSYFKGFAFQSKDYTSHGRRIVRVSDMGFDYIKNETSAIYINEDKAELLEKWKLQKDDLIITTVGSKPPVYDSLVGRTIVVKSKDENSLLNQNAVCLRANKKIKQVFLNTLFKRSEYVSFIESIIRGNANQGSIALVDLFKYKFFQPMQQEQQKIASCLSALDKLIAAQTEKIEQLKLHKKGLMQGLFPKLNI